MLEAQEYKVLHNKVFSQFRAYNDDYLPEEIKETFLTTFFKCYNNSDGTTSF